MKRIHQNLTAEQKIQMLTTDFLDRDQTTFVRISPDGSKADGKIVWVATEVFDDTDLPIGNRIDSSLGIAIHEGCHVLYTDFSAYTGITSRIVKFIENILEDERIERELGQKKPGLANFMKATPNQDKYNDSLSRVRRYIPAISKSLKCSSMEYKLIHRGMRSGMLDTGKISCCPYCLYEGRTTCAYRNRLVSMCRSGRRDQGNLSVYIYRLLL